MHATPQSRQATQQDANELRRECYTAIDHLRVALDHANTNEAAHAHLQAAMLFAIRAVDTLAR